MSDTSVRTIKRRFNLVLNSVSRLAEDKDFFQQYQSFIQSHPTINQQNQFLYFIGINYIEAATLGVFRQVDKNRKSQSLLNILKDIDANAKKFTFRWFDAKWHGGAFARQSFKQFAVKDGSRIDRRKLRKDIAGLKRVTKPIVKYRHKVVAHANKRRIVSPGTINDLYRAIELLEELVIKYNLLLTQSGMSTLRAGNSSPQLHQIFKP